MKLTEYAKDRELPLDAVRNAARELKFDSDHHNSAITNDEQGLLDEWFAKQGDDSKVNETDVAAGEVDVVSETIPTPPPPATLESEAERTAKDEELVQLRQEVEQFKAKDEERDRQEAEQREIEKEKLEQEMAERGQLPAFYSVELSYSLTKIIEVTTGETLDDRKAAAFDGYKESCSILDTRHLPKITPVYDLSRMKDTADVVRETKT